ncbi:hypothetical protein QFC19_005190 [Naganishia cerealis]|uniref:Uncharacterized protein n=1 Tax=Naganishia cerealis TaxID=610337 RepID=A0ACC2VSJ4_9TREE|nr:hypothetical protein QFC19_005190 [Naganishia cerealis]
MTALEAKPITYANPELAGSEKPGTSIHLPYGFGPIPPADSSKPNKVFYFDIDNCLYQRSTRIHDMMQDKIHQYFKDSLQLDDEEAHKLHINYYREYGLALEGLVRNHQVDALEYNAQVDDALDLKSVLHYNQQLRDMLIRIKETHKFDYFWLVTNAYKNHALRVISFLGLGDLFDGLTFCDYSKFPIICKPMNEYFFHFLDLTHTSTNFRTPGVLKQQYVVDDSEINVKAAHRLGFGNVIHYVELEEEYKKLKQKVDFEEFYGSGDNADLSKIRIVRDILDLESVIGN